MVMEKSGLECALDLAAKGYPGIPWHIDAEWAQQLIAKHDLKLECGLGDMSGEGHAIFEHNGEIIRLKRDWMGKYMLFRGEWQPDPHWTGD
jgi:hypothetical protein